LPDVNIEQIDRKTTFGKTRTILLFTSLS